MSELNRPSLLQLRDKKELIGAEIGVQRGLNAYRILSTLDIKKLYLIDPYGVYFDKRQIGKGEVRGWLFTAEKELKPWKEKLIWIRKKSADAADDIPDGELDFVYIDGNHQYEYAKDDIRLYLPKVKKGGLIAGHDYNKLGVKKAVDEAFKVKVVTGKCIPARRPKIDWWVWKT